MLEHRGQQARLEPRVVVLPAAVPGQRGAQPGVVTSLVRYVGGEPVQQRQPVGQVPVEDGSAPGLGGQRLGGQQQRRKVEADVEGVPAAPPTRTTSAKRSRDCTLMG